MRLALFQPDMPQNTGTMLRLGACMGIEVDIIEPCGFVFDQRALRRYGMDYLDLVKYRRHNSWDDFCSYAYAHPEEYGRIVLLTTKSPLRYTDFEFRPTDVLMVGRESAGVPEAVHQSVDARVTIPMTEAARSINVAVSATMVLGEALRQTQLFPVGSGN